MATCKDDCLYYTVCSDFRGNICENDLNRFMAYRMNSDGLCDNFKNKADFVEVPCRCGECKKWKINPNNLYGGYCRHCEGASIDHFCSYGERKQKNDFEEGAIA